jgi:3-phenylpropionate/trans-cinnamate dioxygenase ferredoxin subunit
MGAFHDAIPTDWLAPGETGTVDVDGRIVAFANAEGVYCAFSPQCPHQATPLGGLPLSRGRLLRCPEHGSMFDVTTGECVLASNDGLGAVIAAERRSLHPVRVGLVGRGRSG